MNSSCSFWSLGRCIWLERWTPATSVSPALCQLPCKLQEEKFLLFLHLPHRVMAAALFRAMFEIIFRLERLNGSIYTAYAFVLRDHRSPHGTENATFLACFQIVCPSDHVFSRKEKKKKKRLKKPMYIFMFQI